MADFPILVGLILLFVAPLGVAAFGFYLRARWFGKLLIFIGLAAELWLAALIALGLG